MSRGDFKLFLVMLLCFVAVFAVTLVDWRAVALVVTGQVSAVLLLGIVFVQDDDR